MPHYPHTCHCIPVGPCPLGFIEGRCIKYSGPYLPNLDLYSGAILDDIIVEIDSYLTSIGAVPNLQNVTTIGNSTQNAIVVIGSNNIPTSAEGLFLTHGPGVGSSIASFSPVSGYLYGSLLFTNSGVSLTSQDNAGVGRLMNITSSGAGGSIVITSETINLTFSDLTFNSLTNSPVFNTTVIGVPAINNNEFVTLSQLNANITPPAGLNGQVQYNNTGVFGASTAFTWDETNKVLNVGNATSSMNGEIIIGGSGTGIGRLTGGGGQLNVIGGGLTLDTTGINPLLVKTGTVTRLTITSAGVTTFANAVNGVAATNPTEFVVLSQLTATAVTIVNTSLSSIAIDQAYMNANYASLPTGNTVWFTNLSDDATKALIIRKIGATTWSSNADLKLT